MTKESRYELQLIDCNCNDCKFLDRDFFTFKKYEDQENLRQFSIFEKEKLKAFEIANRCEDKNGKKSLLHIANKMRFIFDRQHLISYGNCLKLNKPVSFLPNICQLETQTCFEHRRS